jgi:hypothetical protein
VSFGSSSIVDEHKSTYSKTKVYVPVGVNQLVDPIGRIFTVTV